MAVDLITSRHLQPRRAAALLRRLRARHRRAARRDAARLGAWCWPPAAPARSTATRRNPDTATGDGIAMAWRAGCRVGNMEFIQFHPTCLYHPQERSFLITEALRGEGGQLRCPTARASCRARRARRARAARHRRPRHRLRDEEARPRLRAARRHAPRAEAFLKEHFPTIYARCLKLGIDITTPADPGGAGGALHLRRRGDRPRTGRTDLPGLYAVGETSYTGLHGANRLASNSLLECVVLGRTCAEDIVARPAAEQPSLPAWDESQVENADEQVVIAHNWDELRLVMWNYVGIVRTTKRLERALHRIELLRSEIDDYYANFRVSRDLLELRNLVDCAELIVRSALMRRESRGLHYSRDFPLPAAGQLPDHRRARAAAAVGALAGRHEDGGAQRLRRRRAGARAGRGGPPPTRRRPPARRAGTPRGHRSRPQIRPTNRRAAGRPTARVRRGKLRPRPVRRVSARRGARPSLSARSMTPCPPASSPRCAAARSPSPASSPPPPRSTRRRCSRRRSRPPPGGITRRSGPRGASSPRVRPPPATGSTPRAAGRSARRRTTPGSSPAARWPTAPAWTRRAATRRARRCRSARRRG